MNTSRSSSRCAWSHQTASTLKEIELEFNPLYPKQATVHVLPQYEQDVRAFAQRIYQRLPFFWLAFVMGIALIIWGGLQQRSIIPSVGLTLIAVTLWFCPFSPPWLMRRFGMRYTVLLIRGMSLGFIIYGVLEIFF